MSLRVLTDGWNGQRQFRGPSLNGGNGPVKRPLRDTRQLARSADTCRSRKHGEITAVYLELSFLTVPPSEQLHRNTDDWLPGGPPDMRWLLPGCSFAPRCIRRRWSPSRVPRGSGEWPRARPRSPLPAVKAPSANRRPPPLPAAGEECGPAGATARRQGSRSASARNRQYSRSSPPVG